MEQLDGCWRGLRGLAAAVKASGDSAGARWGLDLDRGVVVSPAASGQARGVEGVDVWIDARAGVEPPEGDGRAWFVDEGGPRLSEVRAGGLSAAAVSMLGLYGVYALSALRARRLGRSVTVGHFAQSLDGRIATATGDSRWIGDRANQVHAHRMRALCDGILVGIGTARRDRPRLNVRHVEGDDPVRIVLGGHAGEVEGLAGASGAPLWLVGAGEARGVEVIEAEGAVAPEVLLRLFFERGIETIYIEGGQETTSGFLAAGMLDVVQVHVSPIVLGGGQSGFALDGIERVEQAVRFARSAFVPVGEGVMFVGVGPLVGR